VVYRPFLPGSNLSNRADIVLQEMVLLLEAEDMRSLGEWVTGVSDQRDWIAAIVRLRNEKLTEPRQKGRTRPRIAVGWMKSKIPRCFKKENVQAWRSTVA
jgi:hypothetical protein